MPRFFFHVYEESITFDDDGRDLPSADEARAVAEQEARDLASIEVREGRLGVDHRIEVSDENGADVFIVRFQDVIQIGP